MIENPDFERNLSFDELLPAQALERACCAIDTLLGTNVHVSDATGFPRYGAPLDSAEATRIVLSHDLETIGYLTGIAPPDRLRTAAELLHALMHANARYALAASLHFQTTESCFLELQHQHTELLAQRQLYQAEKLASVGQLAAGVAHEINNPLGFMLSNLRSAQDYLEDIAQIKAYVQGEDADAVKHYWQQAGLDSVFDDFAMLLRETQEGAQRVARIVSSLQDFSSIDHGGATRIDLASALTTVCDVATPKISPCALLNLLLNAAEAMPAGRRGHIRIHTSRTGNQARVDISDDAGGIPADVLPRIFDPFFTTRGVGQGTGLGLTVVRDVIKAHNGRLEVENRPGEGTMFSLFLPMDQVVAND